MSTTYYALRYPVVRVDITDNALMGKIYHLVRPDETQGGVLRPDTLHLVADRDNKAAYRDNGGDIVVYATGPDDQQAISEYGELVTLGQLRRGEAP